MPRIMKEFLKMSFPLQMDDSQVPAVNFPGWKIPFTEVSAGCRLVGEMRSF